jgi:hypothetical protein
VAHESCLFVGTPLEGKAPLYVSLFVDDFICFSTNPDVEAHFENELAQKVKVDFMGQADYFFCVQFHWTRHHDNHVSVHLSQEAYANHITDFMGLSNATLSPTMIPHQSGLPMDTLPPIDMSDTE